MRRFLLIIAFSIYSVFEMTAQTVHWAVYPKYKSIERISEKVYKTNQNGKTGLVSTDGTEIVAATCDSITDVYENKSLILLREGRRWRLAGIFRFYDNRYTKIEKPLYVTRYAWFSEGLLAVTDSKGLHGFIDEDGNIVINCKYADVHPFSQGYASVKLTNKKFLYLNNRGRALILEPGDGDIIFASTFCEDEAVVYTTNYKGYVINTSGETLRSYDIDIKKVRVNPKDYTISGSNSILHNVQSNSVTSDNYLFEENGLYGYKNGTYTILPAQFSYAEGFVGNHAVVKHNGEYGILELIEGEIQGGMAKNVVEVNAGVPEMAVYSVRLPHRYDKSNVLLRYADDSGKFAEINSTATSGTDRDFMFRPHCIKNARESSYSFALYSDGLLLYKDTANLKFSYPIKIKLSEPMVENPKADVNDCCYVYVDITNSSGQQLSLSVTFYINNEPYITMANIASGATHRSKISYIVKEKKTVNIKVKTSNGLMSKTKAIELTPFY